MLLVSAAFCFFAALASQSRAVYPKTSECFFCVMCCDMVVVVVAIFGTVLVISDCGDD
jgi:hypothetical protein